VVFGTGHKGPSSPVTGLALDWDTPLGRVTTDRASSRGIHAELGTPPARDVVLHRHEHSLEVPGPDAALGARRPAVPRRRVHDRQAAAGGRRPGEEPWVQELLGAFRGAAAASGQRICWSPGRPRAPRPVTSATPTDRRRAARAGSASASGRASRTSAARTPGRFVASVEAGANRDRVCGTIPIFLTAELAGGPAEILHYGQAAAEDGSQVVSFCAAAFGS
jgi:hypothetical protein